MTYAMPRSSASKLLLSVPLKVVSLVVKDGRVQVPLLLAILYYPHKLRGILPPRIYPWVTSAAFVRVLKGLIGLNIAKFVNRRLSKNALNNWKSDAKFIASREIVLITGGSSGIGEMMARDFARRGVKVIVADLNPPQNSQAGIYFYRMDVTNSEQIASAAADIRRDHGEVTVLINNAGIGVGQTILEEPESVIRKVFEVNTIAHFLMVKEFLPAMIRKDHGHVVTIASMASYVTVAQIVDYNCTKSAALAFHEGLRQELKFRYNAPNVRTTLVNPSWIRTPLIERLTSDARWKEKTLEPEDVVNPIVKQVISGQSGHLVIPDEYGVVSGIRGWPSWLQEALRNSKGHMLDENSMM